ncbi:hypothetical protein [Domibacillus robiginosus]|uniref:hypothetical protein n=1 Tax=Domibacillus robiginosus TaxID=1071054 RepID=UPI00067D086C|nr:hypothetical protein [Domibacillus robiginosus]
MTTFPSKELFFFGLSSAFFTTALYTALLFANGDALFYWMTLSLAASAFFLFTSRIEKPNPTHVSILLAAQLILFFYGWVSLLYLEHISKFALSIIVWVLIGFTVFLFYRLNVMGKKPKMLKRIHAFYITTGLLYGAVTLFLLFISFVLAGPSLMLLLLLIPFLIWVVLYKVQLVLWSKEGNTHDWLMTLPLIGILFIGAYFLLFSE